jgi:dihydrolipoamide dehydrogenase
MFDQGEHIAALRDAEVAKNLKSILGKEFPIHLGVKLDVEKDGVGARLSWFGASSGTASFERVLVAAGRPPALPDLNLAATGLGTNDKGIPKFDPSTLQCGDAPIFLAGDADAQRPVLHEASSEGRSRDGTRHRSQKCGKPSAPCLCRSCSPILRSPWSAPPSDAMVIGSVSYADQGRARVEARNEGLVRVYAGADTGVIAGATLFGPGMDHIAHVFALAIERRETADTLLQLPFYHPTFEEGLKPALREICEAVKSPVLGNLDDIAPPGA